VTANGKAILERTLDITVELADAWHYGDKENPHVGSFLLPHEFVPCLAAFALLSDPNITEVWLHKDGSCSGFGVEDVDLKERLKKHHEGQLRKIYFATSQDRHRHPSGLRYRSFEPQQWQGIGVNRRRSVGAFKSSTLRSEGRLSCCGT
jgi:hypothetical protein